ncbi:MAG: hypothetical protein HQL28_01935 [Candidatus Omnitrophica bacterium]|nr:hypothetical protein [Candidatus Omnitrophota bacterium]
MQIFTLFAIFLSVCLMAIAKRTQALVIAFRIQSFFLFLMTLLLAIEDGNIDLYIIAGLLLVLKVVAIPIFLLRISKRLKASENIGLFINSQLSLIALLVIMYISWYFSKMIFAYDGAAQIAMIAASLTTALCGVFIMIFRMTALTQIIGLLAVENGLFLLASTVSGGMPFIVEIAVFFDVFVSVIIMGIFVYRINKLFTHIDVDKLTLLKG